MSAEWQSDELLLPITADQPCGESLEDTPLLASFDAYRVFGQAKALDAAPDVGEKWTPKPPESPEWVEIRDKASEALGKSKICECLRFSVLKRCWKQWGTALSETLKIASQGLAPTSTHYPSSMKTRSSRARERFADRGRLSNRCDACRWGRSREQEVRLREIEIATGQSPLGW